MQVSVASNIKQVKKQLTAIQKKQIPFAASLAINDVAFQGRKTEAMAMRRYVDRPTPFSQKGFKVTRANKSTMKGSIEVMPNRWKYIKHVVLGGAATRPGAGHAIPINRALENKYGSLPRNKARNLLRQKQHFAITKNGKDYIFKRQGKSIQAQLHFERTTKHKAKYPLWKMTKAMIARDFPKSFNKRMAYALRTAR